MEYVKFTEHSLKESQTYLFYLQYTGNETALNKLKDVIAATHRCILGGDTSCFELNIENRVSSNSVNLHCAFDENIEKVDGRFEFEFNLEGKSYDDIAIDLDDMFYHGHIVNYFKPTDIN